jgi:hypothetical protein
VGSTVTSRECPRTRANTPGNPRTPFRHTRFTDSGATSGAGRRHAASATRTRTVVRCGYARRSLGRRGTGGHEPAGGGRRPGSRPATGDHHPRVGLTAPASSHLGGWAHSARWRNSRLAKPHQQPHNNIQVIDDRRRSPSRPTNGFRPRRGWPTLGRSDQARPRPRAGVRPAAAPSECRCLAHRSTRGR